jgi:hypothetical protein
VGWLAVWAGEGMYVILARSNWQMWQLCLPGCGSLMILATKANMQRQRPEGPGPARLARPAGMTGKRQRTTQSPLPSPPAYLPQAPCLCTQGDLERACSGSCMRQV